MRDTSVVSKQKGKQKPQDVTDCLAVDRKTPYERTKEHSERITASRRKNGKPWTSKETLEKIRIAKIGYLHSEETKRKISVANGAENNYRWISMKLEPRKYYRLIHSRIYRKHGKANKCESLACESVNPKRFEWCNIDHKYSLDEKDWMMMCVSCHLKFDYKYNERRTIKGRTWTWNSGL